MILYYNTLCSVGGGGGRLSCVHYIKLHCVVGGKGGVCANHIMLYYIVVHLLLWRCVCYAKMQKCNILIIFMSYIVYNIKCTAFYFVAVHCRMMYDV